MRIPKKNYDFYICLSTRITRLGGKVVLWCFRREYIMKRYWFLAGILIALLCGYFFSGIGVAANPRGVSAAAIIIMLFFIAGFTLPSHSIKEGLKEYRLHVYIQLFIFVFIPAFVFCTTLPFRGTMDRKVLTGLYAVACLPTTVSSCIVFTHISGGNTAGSMFNSAVANIIGIVVTPMLLSLLMRGAGQGMAAAELFRVLSSLGYKMLAPAAAGQAARIWLKDQAEAANFRLKVISNVLIIIIIFFSFAKAAANPVFKAYMKKMLLPFLYLAAVHIIFAAAAYRGGKLIKLSHQSRIAALYTASQKSAAMGVPFAATFFSGSPELLGVVLLPIIFYHSFQLFTAGVVKTLPFIREGG